MKKTVLNLILFVFFATPMFAIHTSKNSKNEVPSVVKDSFARRFPNVKAKWEKEDNKFEAEFKKDGKKMSATYNENGVWLETEMEISVSDLPAIITEYVKDTHHSKIRKAYRITGVNGVVTYEVETRSKELIFNSQGSFLKEGD
jgi:hypothetical protein